LTARFISTCSTVTGHPVFEERKGWFWTQTRVLAEDAHGPTLHDMAIPQALQGGRHRVSDRSRRLVYEHFGLT